MAKPVSDRPVDLAKLDATQIGNSFRFDPDAHGQRVVAMMQHIDALKAERAQKAICAGLYLEQMRTVLGHGSFEKWAAQHLGKTVRTARNYMALAAKFCRSSKLLPPELVGANQLTIDLQAKGSDGAAFLEKLRKFVGPVGLTDLMRRHGVIKQGGARTPRASAASGEAGDTSATPAATTTTTGGDTSAVLSPAARAYQQMHDAIEATEKVLLDDVRWSFLSPDQAARVEPLLKRLVERYHARLLQARHEHAA